MATIVNCLSMQYIANHLANGTIDDPHHLAEKYNILPNNDTSLMHSPQGYPVVSNCLSAYCNVSETDCSGLLVSETYVEFSSRICYGLDLSLNPDVGGIGVTISYIMQSLILLAAYAVLSLSDSWIKWASLPVHIVKSKKGEVIRKPEISEAYQKAKDYQSTTARKLRLDKQRPALIAALVEFQKTQVFFMLTVEVAVIIALYNAAYVSATSWDQLWTNLGFMQAVGFNGIDPIVFGMLLLRKGGKSSWYLCLLSLSCVLLPSITIFKSYGTSVKKEQITHKISGLAACFDEDPSQYYLMSAYEAVWNTEVTSSSVALWAVSPTIMLVIQADKLASYKSKPGISRMLRAFNAADQRLRIMLGPRIYWGLVRCSVTIGSMFTEIWLVWRLCSGIIYYLAIMADTTNTSAGIWPFGTDHRGCSLGSSDRRVSVSAAS